MVVLLLLFFKKIIIKKLINSIYKLCRNLFLFFTFSSEKGIYTKKKKSPYHLTCAGVTHLIQSKDFFTYLEMLRWVNVTMSYSHYHIDRNSTVKPQKCLQQTTLTFNSLVQEAAWPFLSAFTLILPRFKFTLKVQNTYILQFLLDTSVTVERFISSFFSQQQPNWGWQ